MECIKCGCTDNDCGQCVAAQGHPCHWVAEGKCSRCFDKDGNARGTFLLPPFTGSCNCTYTTSSGSDIKTSIPALMELMESIPTPPTIMTMSIEFRKAAMLPPNTILLSSDIADALEEAINSPG